MSLNHDKLKKRRAGSRSGTGWRPRDGSNKIRLLPPHSKYLNAWDQMEDLSISYKMHFFRIEGRPTEVTRCLEESKQRCPACDAWRAYRKSTDPAMKELAGQVSPSDQYLFNVLDLSDMQKGIQSYGANYTVWDKIMEVAANPAWGNIVDPANGINFDINLTPGTRSRTGFNSYSVTPEPTRTSIMNILQSIPDWQATLDALEDQITPAKEPQEIMALLVEMGFPPTPAARPASPGVGLPSPSPVRDVSAMPMPVAAPMPSAPMAIPGVPQPVAPAMPVAMPAAAPIAQPVAMPMAAAPAPAEPAPVAPIPSGVGAMAAPVAAPVLTGVHYDPGPSYVNTKNADIPHGAPRCFGDYEPAIHRCTPCPLVVDCQMKLIGIG